jgi:AAA+ ATPase superfamily predicted ATPase
MKFYDREKETETLQKIETLTAEYAQMTVATGRRIGKATLVKHSCMKIPFIYFFVGRKSEVNPES